MKINRCYHCNNSVNEPVTDHEFHQDGVYCSHVCLRAEMKMVQDWDEEVSSLIAQEKDFDPEDDECG